jgi:hypothetical protein
MEQMCAVRDGSAFRFPLVNWAHAHTGASTSAQELQPLVQPPKGRLPLGRAFSITVHYRYGRTEPEVAILDLGYCLSACASAPKLSDRIDEGPCSIIRARSRNAVCIPMTPPASLRMKVTSVTIAPRSVLNDSPSR